MRQAKGTPILTPKTPIISDTWGAIQVHRVINFFLARTDDVMLMGGWNPFQRYNEHEEFFVRLIRHRLKVLFLKTFMV